MATSVSVPKKGKRTASEISAVMSRIASTRTGPEILLQKALRRAGVRSFRIHDSTLPGKPDIVLPGKRVAIFVDGDFWHGNQYRSRGFESLDEQLFGVRNAEYWITKIGNNIERDFANTQKLIADGWKVLRFWESQLRQDLDKCVSVVCRAANQKRNAEAAAYGHLSARDVIELFAGIGLVRLGLHQAGWQTVFANDNDPAKIDMYKANFGLEGFNNASICDLTAKDFPTAALVTASFPCNDLSLAGARNGLNGRHSSTFWALIRILQELKSRKPPIVLIENVPGFLSSHDGKDFESALRALNSLGYACDAFIVDAARFTPQSRVRLFVVAHYAASPSQNLITSVSEHRSAALVDFINGHPNIDWDIRSLPRLPDNRLRLISVLEDLSPEDPRWWSPHRAEYFLNQLSPRHLSIAHHMIAQNDFSYATAFRRIRNGRSMAEIRIDGFAGCLRTPRGGSGRQILFKAGKGKYAVRLLTPRECARLQGVQDYSYKIEARDNQALFGFGDAVCVPVIEWIARNYLTPLAAEIMRGHILKEIRS